MSNESSPDQENEFESFTIDYVKSRLFRVVFAEGVWGCMTANGNIHMAFWNSREAIPRQIVYGIGREGDIVEKGRKVRADQVREVEVGVVMDLETARLLRTWLDDMISETEELDEAEG